MRAASLLLSLCSLSASLNGFASAAGTPIRAVLTGSGGQTKTSTDSFVVVKRTSDLKPFHLHVLLTNTSRDRVRDLILAVKLVKLTPAEFDLLRGNATYVATRCFGLEVAQLPRFSAWLAQQNAGPGQRVIATFGKVSAVYLRQNKPGAPYTTVELYRDADQPGVSPWLNYCMR